MTTTAPNPLGTSVKLTDVNPSNENAHKMMRFIQEYRARNDMSPTYQEIADHLGVSRPRVFDYANALVYWCYVSRVPKRPCSLRLTPAGEDALRKQAQVAVMYQRQGGRPSWQRDLDKHTQVEANRKMNGRRVG